MSAKGATSAGARSVGVARVLGVLRARRTGAIRGRGRIEQTGCSFDKGTGREVKPGGLCRLMSSKPLLVAEWEGWTRS